MSQISAFLRKVKNGHSHWCPGCKEMHVIPDGWAFNGDVEKPTFSPSVKITGVQTVVVDGEWTGEFVYDAARKPLPYCCHYILTAGRIQFCGDSTHALTGKTVPLPPLPPELTDSLDGDAA